LAVFLVFAGASVQKNGKGKCDKKQKTKEDLMLVFFGLLFFVALALAVFLDRRARKHQEIEILKRIYAGFIPLPLILAGTIVANGWLDSPKKITYHPTTVVGRYFMKGVIR